ncbi:MAG: hypothetical protein ABSG68_04360 [Thermoguttaceae bacterium]|jgi:hypothetical protein
MNQVAVKTDCQSGPPDSKSAVRVRLSPEVLGRARDAVEWTSGLTLSQLVEEAVVREIARLEACRGMPFPRIVRQVES